MAILESLLGVEVSIWSDDSQLPEYEDNEDNVRLAWKHKTVSNYVESKEDAEFFFKFKVGPPYVHDCDELGFAIVLDGCEENIDSHLCGPQNLEDDGEWEHEVRGVETNDEEGAKIHTFRFSKLLTTDEQAGTWSKEEKASLKKIGQIEVRVHQMERCRMGKRLPKQLRSSPGIVPEKFLGGQAISHRISYDSEERLSAPSVYEGTKYMHGWDGPIGVFRFKYRSRSDLQKELIIPRTPSPEPLGLPTVPELTTEEKFRLARMRFDDLEMLKSLTAARTRSTVPSRETSQRSFGDLTPEEIDLLATEKHSEMRGVPIIKKEARKIIKTEPSITRTSRSPHHRPFKEFQRSDGKRIIDLVSSSSDTDSDPETDGEAVSMFVGKHTKRKKMGANTNSKSCPPNSNLRYPKSRFANSNSYSQSNSSPSTNLFTCMSTPTPTALSDPQTLLMPPSSSAGTNRKLTSKSVSRRASKHESDERVGREEEEDDEDDLPITRLINRSRTTAPPKIAGADNPAVVADKTMDTKTKRKLEPRGAGERCVRDRQRERG